MTQTEHRTLNVVALIVRASAHFALVRKIKKWNQFITQIQNKLKMRYTEMQDTLPRI